MEGNIIEEIKNINEEIMLPTNDYVFHRLFGHVGNEDLTSGLISSILNQEIETIKIDETQITEQNIKDDKVGVLKARQDYNVLHRTIAILIANFELDNLKEIPKFHTKWQIREEEFRKIILIDTLEIHIIELPKLVKQLRENKRIKKEKLVLWLLFLLNPDKIGDETMNENNDIKKAKEELERIKLNEKDRRLAELRLKYILDQNSIRNSGFREGLKEGKEIGLQEGKEIGKKSEKIKTAKKLLALNMPLEQITQITDLTEEEIKNIK